ncbi:BRCT domain-containing protein [Hydrogenophaga sp.]|uniref:BRCT domain-containing protein n=1 Tax=Hydrogenophaga sp. TaxID=1904254 RepID=UPI003F6B0BAD
MANEKVTRILKAKSPFSADQIAAMTDAVGWDWIYANAKPKKEKLTQVCFTGFAASEKAELSALAQAASLEIVGSVTKNLAFLCVGENAGPAKLEKAREQGNHILTKEQFLHLLETGELTQ